MFTTLLFAVAFLALAYVIRGYVRLHRINKHLCVIPAPPGALPIIGHALQLLSEPPWTKMRKWASSYGTMVQFDLPGQKVLYVNDPLMLKRILLTNQRNYRKDLDTSYKHFMCLLGRGLVTSEDEAWRRGRILLSHALKIDILHEIPQIAGVAINTLDQKLRQGKPLDVAEEFRHLTLQVIGAAALSMSPDETDRIFPKLYLPVVLEGNRRVWAPYRQYLPLPGCIERTRCLWQLNRYLERAVTQRWEQRKVEKKQSIERRQDILDRCLSQVEATADGVLSSEMLLQFRDDVKTMLLAGHETSASLLTWATYELVLNPKYQDRIREEYQSVVVDAKEPLTLEDYRKMKWTVAVLRETARKYSVVPLVMRIAAEDDVVPASVSGLAFDFTIPKGTTIAVGIEGVHHRADLWPSPDSFQPERFLDFDITEQFSFIPFIMGPRNCLGQHLAMLDTQLVLSTLFHRFDFSVVGDLHKVGMKHPTIIPITPVNGLTVVATPRLQA